MTSRRSSGVEAYPRPKTLSFEFTARLRCVGRKQHWGKPLSSIRVKKTTAKPEISDQIGRQLRSVYNDILAQPVPDRFLDLLKDIDAMVLPRGVQASVQGSVQGGTVQGVILDKKVAK